MITLSDIQEAYGRIKPYVRRTPTVRNHTLSHNLGTNLYLKLELFQKTGSFKPRGAFNKMLGLDSEQAEPGVVAISGGNFAQGVAYAGSILGIRTLIIMPAYTPANYIAATRAYGGQVELAPDFPAALQLAEQYRQQGWCYFHAWDDPQVMEGYGTIGLELLEELPEITDVVISVGGGALMSGTVSALKALKPEVRIWTVETEGADALNRALHASQVVQVRPTSLARTLGASYVSPVALEIAQQHVNQHVLVTDQEAYHALRFLLEHAKVATELAASCTLAAARQLRANFTPEDHVILILCGGNIALEDLIEYARLFE